MKLYPKNRTFSIKESNTINQCPDFGVPQGSVLVDV